ncbi:PilX N-terminal domain-containing pilus assembly protein [Pseudomonas sp. OHS18]|uniref:PilX N-terminal domain-containing pilus assembly protein n=1 Tax=Pseudomonas sp. OHS18 TaxID=3399679 RepID=UPI003A849181
MTHLSNRQSQTGAVLVVALVMLLVLTLMAVGSMRGTTLESRITANRAHDTQQQSAADAALREAEFRYYGPANLIDKLEGKAANCKLTNTLNVNGLNKPCLLAINDADLLNFVDNPWLTKESFLKSESAESLYGCLIEGRTLPTRQWLVTEKPVMDGLPTGTVLEQ